VEAGLRSVNRNPASHPRLFSLPFKKTTILGTPSVGVCGTAAVCRRTSELPRVAATAGEEVIISVTPPPVLLLQCRRCVCLSVCLSVTAAQCGCYYTEDCCLAVGASWFSRLYVCLHGTTVGRARLQLPIATGTVPAQRERSSQH